jgi:hypothetical protein
MGENIADNDRNVNNVTIIGNNESVLVVKWVVLAWESFCEADEKIGPLWRFVGGIGTAGRSG